jgi:hypothetical protein
LKYPAAVFSRHLLQGEVRIAVDLKRRFFEPAADRWENPLPGLQPEHTCVIPLNS